MEHAPTAVAGHKAAVETVFPVWNTEEYGKLDAAMALDFRRHGVDADVQGLDAMKDFMRQVHATYSDFHIQLHDSAHEGDLAFTHWTVTGSLRDNGRPFTVRGATMLRFENDLITEETAYWDTAAGNAQLGVDSVAHVR